MDELVQLMRQRSSDIEFMQKPFPHNVSELLVREKDRSQKQNWVLKVLKSIKILTPQLKSQAIPYHRDIFCKSQQMMSIYENIPLQQKQNLDEHFTQKVINLYIDFFNLISEKLPSANSIKALMRPNNGYIITDLIKCLIDLQRKKLRDLCLVSTSLEGEIKTHRKKIVNDSLNDNETTLGLHKSNQLQKVSDLKQIKLHNPQELIKKVLKQKFTNFIKMMDLKELQNRVNINFLELKEKNQKNGYFMQKFREKCLGKRLAKTTNYDLAGLYTKEELRKIEENLNAKILSQKGGEGLQLRDTECPTEHEDRHDMGQSLRQKALTQLQKMQNLSIYQKASSRKLSSLQPWLPLTLGKRLSKQSPWQVYIIHNRHKIKSNEIISEPQISSIGVRQYILAKLQLGFGVSEKLAEKEEGENKWFDKRVFVDFGRRREFEMLEGDRVVLRRELFLPVMKQFEEREVVTERRHKEPESQLRRKSTSEPKFLPRFAKMYTQHEKSLLEQEANSSVLSKLPSPEPYHQVIAKSQQLKSLSPRKQPLTLRTRKNSIQEILNQKILQRKLQIEEQNSRYQNKVKLLFGTENHKNLIRAKNNKKHKTSIMGISIPFGNEHLLQ